MFGCIFVVDCFVIFYYFVIENFLLGKKVWKFIVFDGDIIIGFDIKIIWWIIKKNLYVWLFKYWGFELSNKKNEFVLFMWYCWYWDNFKL